MQQDKRFSDYSARAVRLDNQTEDDEIEIDFRAIASTLWRHKWVLVISIFMGGLLAFLVTSQMEPKYRATATMLFNTAAPNIVELGLEVTGGQLTDTLQEEMETLRSTTLLGRVVDVMGLENNPTFNPKLIEEEPNLFQRFFGTFSGPSNFIEIGQNLGLAAPTNPDIISPDPIELAEIDRLSVIRRVADGLSLEPVGRSDVLRVSYTSDNPRLSALIANTVAEQYIEDQLQANLDATRAATEWISERVEELRIRVQQAEEAVEVAWATQSAQSGRSLESIQQQQAALNEALVSAQEQTSLLQSQHRELRKALDTEADIRAYTAFRASPFIEGYMTTQEELLTRRDELATTVPETHSAILRLDTRINAIQSRIDAEAERITNAARSDWLAARNSVATLEQQLRELQSEALEQSQQSVAIRQLEREAQASRLLFENFLAREKETATQEELQSADARVISPAEIPLSPVSSGARRTQLLGLILGALAGLGLVFLLEKLNNAFRFPNQVEDMTGEPVLALLPSIGRKVKGADVLKKFRDSPKSSLAEAVRNLRTSVLFANAKTSPQVILFTSSVPSEGKSTTATLMAMTSRQMGKSAIIVDCDLRLPSLERIFAPENKKKPGFFSFLKGEAALDEAIYVDPETDLHVLMPRDYEPRWDLNPADVLSSKLFEALIAALKKKYDRIILDLPPTLVVSDARIAATHADAVVYMIRWDHTPRGAVIEGLNELRAVQAPLAGVVLGQVNETRAARYSYGGFSYYRGRYRSYYVN